MYTNVKIETNNTTEMDKLCEEVGLSKFMSKNLTEHDKKYQKIWEQQNLPKYKRNCIFDNKLFVFSFLYVYTLFILSVLILEYLK